PGKDQVVVLSHVLWVNQFGADPSIVNRTILLDNLPHTVVGVLPAGSAFDRAFNQLWRPLAFEPSNMTRNFHWLTSFARLKDGVSLQQAKANMDAIGKRIEQEYPDSNKGWGVLVERYAETLINPDLRTALFRTDWRNRYGPPDRLREPGEHFTRSRHRARARGDAQSVARRRTLATRPPVSHRER